MKVFFDKGLFQLSRERICLFIASVWQDAKNCMFTTALGLPEDMSHRFIFALEVQDFP